MVDRGPTTEGVTRCGFIALIGAPHAAKSTLINALIGSKVDLVEKARLLALAQTANDTTKFEATFMISATKGDGVADVRQWLAAHVPAGPWHYPEDEVSDAPVRQLASEITREKLYLK